MNLTSDVLADLLKGVSLTRAEACDVLASVLRGEIDPAVIASFLTLLAQRGETTEEMTGFVDAMLAASEGADVPADAMDIVGTGGDRSHSVNISTMAALTVAACGVPVAKHGNRAASSSVGTADVLEGVGVNIDIDGSTVARCVREAGMGFFFAQRFHPGLRHLGPIRRALGFPTAFNVLGPLANPGRVQRLLIGVANAEMMPKMASVLAARNIEKATLLRSDDGLDELSLGASATLVEVAHGEITHRRLDAGALLGVHRQVEEIRGGDRATNVSILEDFVSGKEGAVFDVVTANAALALCVAGTTPSLGDGFDAARSAVRSGGAAKVLRRLIEVSNGLSPSNA